MEKSTENCGTIEDWAVRYILAEDLGTKLDPPPPPRDFSHPRPASRRIERPGRPPELQVVERAPRMPKKGLRAPRARARLLHTFLHHELQAAELMLWALLAFPDTPEPFRRGLVGIFQDEIRHLQLYRAHLERLGMRYGDEPVRDWFWQRIPEAKSPLEFVACLGIGFEGGNLDHAARFAARFRAAGDEEGAQVQELVGDEEVRHVRFAVHWFRVYSESDPRFSGGLTFENWCAALPGPLSPLTMRGPEINREERARAGLDDAFLDALALWRPEDEPPSARAKRE